MKEFKPQVTKITQTSKLPKTPTKAVYRFYSNGKLHKFETKYISTIDTPYHNYTLE